MVGGTGGNQQSWRAESSLSSQVTQKDALLNVGHTWFQMIGQERDPFPEQGDPRAGSHAEGGARVLSRWETKGTGREEVFRLS